MPVATGSRSSAYNCVGGIEGAEEYYHGVTMEALCSSLSTGTGYPPIHDETGLKGRYDFKLHSYESMGIHDEEMTPWDIGALGLGIKPAKVSGFSIVIDHIERPDEN